MTIDISPSDLENKFQKKGNGTKGLAQLTKSSPHVPSLLFLGALVACVTLTLAVLVWLLQGVFAQAIPVLEERGLTSFLNGGLTSRTATYGVSEGLSGSFWVLVFVAVLAFPLGVAAAIYLEEYARDTWANRITMLCIRNLAGVPSVVYGILGLTVFVEMLRGVTGGASKISAGFTMAILVLPIVIITTTEAIRAVPKSLREAGYGVGATRWELLRSHVLPVAAPGILTGTVLAFARAVGEAAPLIIIGATTGFLGNANGNIMDSLRSNFTALPVNVYTTIAKRPAANGWPAYGAATIVILMALLLTANTVAILARNHFEKKRVL